MEIILDVKKLLVYDEVAKTSSYTGAKMAGDDAAYDRIFTTDEDRLMLERFWLEAAGGATEKMKPFIVSVAPQPVSQRVDLTRDYTVRLKVSVDFEPALRESTETSLYDYFVNFIVSRWYKFTCKEEIGSYATDAVAALEDVLRKLYYKKKPTRIPV